MVSFEEIIKEWELRHIILKYLMKGHKAVYEASENTIDMDVIQR